ncbi:RRP15-like protein [Synchiropus splendidus]|uniref:RRP15-like protein n=1 Tax=Synchiropus splendidus TaxID=270530 RepID=UPI00237D7DEF|nr:RRP15-like protein [Synchiropus splendidus]
MAALTESHVQISHESDEMVDSGDDGGSQDEVTGDEGESDGSVVGEDEEGGNANEDDGNPNAGWAEAMAKILGKKTPENSSGILVKSKELVKIKQKEKEAQQEKKKQVDKKRTWEMMCRVKPDLVKDRETERAMQRIATRGVVQLFNAVRQHQKTVDDKVKKVGGSERKKAKILSAVSKRDFIDVLRGTGDSPAGIKEEDAAAAVRDEKPGWSVLRDDFMMGAAMKDWDKDSDHEEEETHKPVDDSESD